MPPLLVPADCGTIPLRTSHAVSQGRNWTRSEQPDAAHTAGTLIEASHQQRRRQRRQPDGAAAARGRQTCAQSAGSAGGHSRCGREHPARKARGRRVHARRARLPRC
jgi:hypothetical protein